MDEENIIFLQQFSFRVMVNEITYLQLIAFKKTQCFSGVFSTGAMGALAPAILKNRLSAPAISGHFSTVEKSCGC